MLEVMDNVELSEIVGGGVGRVWLGHLGAPPLEKASGPQTRPLLASVNRPWSRYRSAAGRLARHPGRPACDPCRHYNRERSKDRQPQRTTSKRRRGEPGRQRGPAPPRQATG